MAYLAFEEVARRTSQPTHRLAITATIPETPGTQPTLDGSRYYRFGSIVVGCGVPREKGVISITAPVDKNCDTRVLMVDRPREYLEHELLAQAELCSEVCTSRLVDAAAAQRGLLVAT